jgi:hypothetical protein
MPSTPRASVLASISISAPSSLLVVAVCTQDSCEHNCVQYATSLMYMLKILQNLVCTTRNLVILVHASHKAFADVDECSTSARQSVASADASTRIRTAHGIDLTS